MHTRLIAHRGGSGLRVENTLAAFEHAIRLGAAGAELDVHLSRDGEVVVHHDDRLNAGYCRAADGHWLAPETAPVICSLTVAELQQYEIGEPKPGSDYARRFPRILPVRGQHIPLLQDVIALAAESSPSFELVIEIKTPPLAARERPWRLLVERVIDVVRRADFVDRAILCSFDWGSLRYAKQILPQLRTWFTSFPLGWFAEAGPRAEDLPPSPSELAAYRAAYAPGDAPWFDGFDPRRYSNSHVEAVYRAGGNAWFPFHRDFNAEIQAASSSRNMDSAVWSVNLSDAGELGRLVRAGVGYIVTDYPDQDLRLV
ncbi:MAG: hypothetical protein JSR56_06900 [Proteobacteria bacterium]|nr:hypothetical protein [Pseudomonadota bacterium]